LSLTKKHLKLKGFNPVGEAGKALEKLIEQKVVNIAPFGEGKIEDGKITEYKIYGLQLALKQ
jgi:hypothetical protein